MHIEWYNVAKLAYQAYAESINNAPSRSQVSVSFDQLSNELKEAWIAAVQKSHDALMAAIMA